jgi:hypothetical protein
VSDVVDSVNGVLKDCQSTETSSFYKDHQTFSKLYNSLIQEGVTQRRESQLKTIQDQEKIFPFSYNVTK